MYSFVWLMDALYGRAIVVGGKIRNEMSFHRVEIIVSP